MEGHPVNAVGTPVAPLRRLDSGSCVEGRTVRETSVKDTARHPEHGSSRRSFVTSVSAQLLPPKLQQQLRAEGRRFLELSPKADDVWLHYMEVAHG